MTAADSIDPNRWIFYRDRLEWKDVTPIKQDDDDVPVIKITYSEKFADVFDYVRAVMYTSEKSDRALAITKDALLLNPANYSVWQYRRDLLTALNKSWRDELHFITDMIEENPKNYQVWHHRRCVIIKLTEENKNAIEINDELEFTKRMFEDDAKNYHGWDYRQFLLTHFNAFGKEIEFTDWLIETDLYNNSAWNQRFFVLTHVHFNPLSDQLRKAAATSNPTEDFDAAAQKLRAVVRDEIQLTTTRIDRAPSNESAWSFLRGLIQTFCRIMNTSVGPGSSSSKLAHMTDFGELLAFTESIIERHTKSATSSFAHEFALDFRAALLERNSASADVETQKGKMREHIIALVEIDPIRSEWWNYLSRSYGL